MLAGISEERQEALWESAQQNQVCIRMNSLVHSTFLAKVIHVVKIIFKFR